MNSVEDSLLLEDPSYKDLADEILAKLPDFGFTPDEGGFTHNLLKRSFSQATPEIEKIAEDFGLELKTFHLAKTMPGYFQGMHHDQDSSLYRVGVLYLTGEGRLIFPGEKIELDTTPGKLVIFRPDMIHYVPPQAEGRYFIRMDFSN